MLQAQTTRDSRSNQRIKQRRPIVALAPRGMAVIPHVANQSLLRIILISCMKYKGCEGLSLRPCTQIEQACIYLDLISREGQCYNVGNYEGIGRVQAPFRMKGAKIFRKASWVLCRTSLFRFWQSTGIASDNIFMEAPR